MTRLSSVLQVLLFLNLQHDRVQRLQSRAQLLLHVQDEAHVAVERTHEGDDDWRVVDAHQHVVVVERDERLAIAHATLAGLLGEKETRAVITPISHKIHSIRALNSENSPDLQQWPRQM